MTKPWTIEEMTPIGRNSHGYRFAVGRIGLRWIGYAHCPGDDLSPPLIFVFPQVAEGYTLGLLERDEAIRLTAAVAQDPEAAYGGIDRWFVPPPLRATPADYRCARCDELHPRGQPCLWDDFGPDDFE